MPSESERTVTADEAAKLTTEGWTEEQILYLQQRLRDVPRFSLFHDLVLSGPTCSNVPVRETAAVYRELIETAEHELILVSYALVNGRQIFEPLAAKLRLHPELSVHLFLDISRSPYDRTLSCELVAKYRRQFVTTEWPWEILPKIYYFKPSLEMDAGKRASMHAKLIIADRKRVFVTSANLTKAAQEKNIEVGVILEDEQPASRLAGYFMGLFAAGEFVEF